MDLPIKIIVTLFVALVVGGSIILFAQRTINSGEQQLHEIGKTEKGVSIISLPSGATAEDVKKLAFACVQLGIGYVAEKECFVVKGNIPSDLSSIDNTIVDGKTIDVTSSASATALFITYNPLGKIIISS